MGAQPPSPGRQRCLPKCMQRGGTVKTITASPLEFEYPLNFPARVGEWAPPPPWPPIWAYRISVVSSSTYIYNVYCENVISSLGSTLIMTLWNSVSFNLDTFKDL